jgi:hypothetical protein
VYYTLYAGTKLGFANETPRRPELVSSVMQKLRSRCATFIRRATDFCSLLGYGLSLVGNALTMHSVSISTWISRASLAKLVTQAPGQEAQTTPKGSSVKKTQSDIYHPLYMEFDTQKWHRPARNRRSIDRGVRLQKKLKIIETRAWLKCNLDSRILFMCLREISKAFYP